MCDVCSAREVWTDDGTSLPRDRLPDGWLIKKYDRGVVRHLCPACATRATVRHRVENDPA
jgi:hypothetical protein